MTNPRILFAPDGGPDIGGGHVMRSLTLARAAVARGARCDMVASPFTAALLDRYGQAAIGRMEIGGEDPAEVAAKVAEIAREYDAVVFDHYRLGGAEHGRARGEGRLLMAIEDLADRAMDVDILLDPGPARRAEDYAGRTPKGAQLFLGPAYAPVRPEFAMAREAAMARRGGQDEVGRVLVSLGLTDLGGITARVVNRLLPRLGEARLDVVLGGGATSLDAMRRLEARDERVSVHVDAADMAGLCAAADVAVGAGGSSLWERCAVGLPGVLVVLAENQTPAARAVETAGATMLADARDGDFDAALDRAFTGLLRSQDRRKRMARAAAGVCNGRGAERAVEALLSDLHPTG